MTDGNEGQELAKEIRDRLRIIEEKIDRLTILPLLLGSGPLPGGGTGGGGGQADGPGSAAGGGGGGGGFLAPGGAGGSASVVNVTTAPPELLQWLATANPDLAHFDQDWDEPTKREWWENVRAWTLTSTGQVPAAIVGAVIAGLIGH